MGNRNAIMSLLTFADKVEPSLWERHEDILAEMDLQGSYQRKNLRTVLAALDVISARDLTGIKVFEVTEAILNAASRTGFRGRWEKVSDEPWMICDIGHNEHGLRHNFAQLDRMRREGDCSDLIIVYGSVADKDVDAVMHLMPEEAVYVFTQANGKRALAASAVRDKYVAFCEASGRGVENVHVAENVPEAFAMAMNIAAEISSSRSDARPLIYIGGSTYVVSEAVALL